MRFHAESLAPIGTRGPSPGQQHVAAAPTMPASAPYFAFTNGISRQRVLMDHLGNCITIRPKNALISSARWESGSTTLAQAGEIVRACLIQCRNNGLEHYADFLTVLREYCGRNWP